MKYDSIFEVRKAWLETLGGDPSPADNTYEVSLLLLDWYQNPPVPPVPPVPPGPTPITNYDGLVFHSNTDNSSVALINKGGNEPSFEYSTDGVNWNAWDYTAINLDKDEEIAFRSSGVSLSYNNRSVFDITGNVSAKGNIMSLLDDGECTATTVPDCAFICLFSGCTGLYDVSQLELPATTLGNSSYHTMFAFCPITSTPVLSAATSIPEGAMMKMFVNCTSLTTAPSVLPATTLYGNAYHAMFSGCTSLTTAPALPATSFQTGRVYQEMFAGCSSLVTAPVLPAATLTFNSYESLFNGCTSLSAVTIYANNVSANQCLNNWLNNTAQNGLIVKRTDAFWVNEPASWTVEYSGRTEASVSSLNVGSASSVQTIYVQTDSYGNTWTATCPAWCTLSTTVKTDDRTQVVVTAQENTGSSRSGNMIITATDRTITIPITQSGSN